MAKKTGKKKAMSPAQKAALAKAQKAAAAARKKRAAGVSGMAKPPKPRKRTSISAIDAKIKSATMQNKLLTAHEANARMKRGGKVDVLHGSTGVYYAKK